MSTIALFGATGLTGKHFLQFALDAGYKVRAMVRNPAKVVVEQNREDLTIIRGSFDDVEKIEETLDGADYVICMAGMTPGMGKNYPKDAMLNFVKMVYVSFEKKPPMLFLYQSGSGSGDGEGKVMLLQRILRNEMGWALGFYPNVFDNENVGKYMLEHKNDNFAFVCTRPGGLIGGKSKGRLKASLKDFPFFPMTPQDVAAATLEVINDESLYNKFPFIVYA